MEKPRGGGPLRDVITGGRTREMLATCNEPKAIDGLVAHLRNNYFTKIIHQPLLLASDEILPRTTQAAGQRSAITADSVPSALWNNHVRNYYGTAQNMAAELLDPDLTMVKIPNGMIDQGSAVTFSVHAELVSDDQRVEGEVRRLYTLYLTPRMTHRRPFNALLDQAAFFYNPNSLRNTRILWVASICPNRHEEEVVMRDNRRRIEGSINRARQIEAFRQTHPSQGGLPSLGK